ncbi:hypothetical protein D3C76_465200 [compost metagenome]
MPGAQQHSQPLADIQLPDLDLAERHRLPRYPQRQQHHATQPAQWYATRHQNQQRTQAHQQPGPQRQNCWQPRRLLLRHQLQQPEKHIEQTTRQPQQHLPYPAQRQQQGPQQRQRQYRQADPRHRNKVGQRRTQAHWQTRSQQHRQQTDGNHPLRPRPGLPGPPAAQAGTEAIAKRGHGRERQPEPGQQRGQRLHQQHGNQRQQQRQGRTEVAKAQAPEQHHGQHQAGTLHRYTTTGQPTVGQCRSHGQATRPGQPGQTSGPQPPTRQPGNQAIQQAGNQADVLARDHQQVHRAGGLQPLPVLPGQARPVAKHQRHQRCLPAIGLDCQQALAQRVAPAAGNRRQQLPGLDRTGRTYPPRQQLRLTVRPMRVEQPGRALQGHRQPPLLARPQRRAVEPAQLQALRQLCPPRAGRVQLETHPLRSPGRQADHLALKPQGAAIQPGGQAVIQRLLRRPAGPTQAQQKTAQRPQSGEQAEATGYSQQHQPSDRWQCGEKAQAQQPERERKHPCAHEVELQKRNHLLRHSPIAGSACSTIVTNSKRG